MTILIKVSYSPVHDKIPVILFESANLHHSYKVTDSMQDIFWGQSVNLNIKKYSLCIHSHSYLVTLLLQQILIASHHIPSSFLAPSMSNIHRQSSYSKHSESASLCQGQIVIQTTTKFNHLFPLPPRTPP